MLPYRRPRTTSAADSLVPSTPSAATELVVLRNYAAAAMAIPVILVVYLSVLVRRSIAARIVLALGVGGLIGVGIVGLLRPSGTIARPPTELTAVAIAPEIGTVIETGRSPVAPVTITFGAPMDVASVGEMLVVTPPTPVSLSWDVTGTTLTVSPDGAWAASTYHTITVRAGALAASGRPSTTDIRAAFLTRPATLATVEPTATAGSAVELDTAIAISFDRPIDPATLTDALTIEPDVAGTLLTSERRGVGDRWLFVPDAPLVPGTTYRVTLAPTVLDAEGAPVAVPAALEVTTGSTPEVVRFRPRNGTTGVDRSATLSVRFTTAMDRASTAAAWSVSVGETPVAGTISWAEGDTVLVFMLKQAFGYSAKVTMAVGEGATSAAGIPLAAAATGTFTTVPKPAVQSIPKPSGGAVGTATWGAVEAYYLKLMNCTRTGGTVTSTGACSSPGGRNVAALWIDAGISSKVARPYAKKLAVNGICTHFSGGNPGDRLRAAGYTSYIWAENLGCRSGDPFKAVLGSHLYFQSERTWSPQGGHYVNLMNAKYDRVGIGVWVSSGRVRLVVVFYHPL